MGSSPILGTKKKLKKKISLHFIKYNFLRYIYVSD